MFWKCFIIIVLFFIPLTIQNKTNNDHHTVVYEIYTFFRLNFEAKFYFTWRSVPNEKKLEKVDSLK